MKQWTISWLDCDTWQKAHFTQPVTTSSVVGPRRSSRVLLKAKLAPKKAMVTIWWSAAGVIHCNFLNPGKTTTSEVCSTKQKDSQKTATPAAGTGQHKGPNSSPWQCMMQVTQTTLQKLNELGYGVVPHPPYSPDLLPTDYHFFKHLDTLLQGKSFHKQQDAENAFQEFVESQSMDFYATGINKHFSLAKMCW